MSKAPAGTEPAAASSPWWWTHCSIEDAAEPLDSTADEAAANCLASITQQTSRHVQQNAALLRPYLSPTTTASADLYAQLKWDAVLTPPLSHLRKAMARAWEERMAEQAEAAAVEGAGASQDSAPSLTSSSQPLTQEAATASACADPVLLRRLRVLQQRIYLTFLKAVLQGFVEGLRSVVEQLPRGDDVEEAEETAVAATEADNAHEGPTDTANPPFDPVAAGLSVLMDGLLHRMMEAATAGPAATSLLSGESEKPRRVHHHPHPTHTANASSAAQISHGAGDWFTGMMPLYLRVVQQRKQLLATAKAEDEEAPTPALVSIASPELCLVSYVGIFVQDAGLQLLPTEQAAQLPNFTHKVHEIFLRQLSERCARAESPVDDERAPLAATLCIGEAIHALQRLTESQLHKDECGAEVEDEDCTAFFHAPRLAQADAAVDYDVASLLTLCTYQACGPLLALLERWWVTCRRSLARARDAAAVKSDGQNESEENADAAMAKGDGAHRAAQLTEAEEAWLALRKQAMSFTVVLTIYAESTLFMTPYTALLTRLFYTPSSFVVEGSIGQADGDVVLPLDAWKACIRDIHHTTLASYPCYLLQHGSSSSSHGRGPGGVATGSAATAQPAASARASRAHYRGVGSTSFPAAALMRTVTALDETVRHTLLRVNDKPQPDSSADIPPKLFCLAFALLHRPLSLLQDRILPLLMSAGAVAAQLRVDPAVGEKGSQGVRPPSSGASAVAASAAAAVPADASEARAKAVGEAALTTVQMMEVSFPRHYYVSHSMDRAMQYTIMRSKELAEEAAAAAEGSVWVSPKALPSLFTQFYGALLDESLVVMLRAGNEEVRGSEMLMFCAAVLRMLPRNALPCLRAAIATFLGDTGDRLLPYLRHHIVDQQRHGLVAFFLPPLRALGLDHSTVEDTEISLALATRPAFASAMAYAWELPRLFFWQHNDNEEESHASVSEVAWRARDAAQTYLCELMTHTSPNDSAFLDILVEVSEVAHRRCGAVKVQAPLPTRVAAVDAMTAVFLGMCRWSAVQLAALRSSPSPSLSVPPEALRSTVMALCAQKRPSDAPLHPYLVSLLAQLKDAGHGVEESESQMKEEGEVKEAAGESSSSSSPGLTAPDAAVSRVATWFWATGYDEVDPAHVLACARRLLRDFSARFAHFAPVKTVLRIRAVIETGMRAEEDAVVAATRQKLAAALKADLQDLLDRQHQRTETGPSQPATNTTAESAGAKKEIGKTQDGSVGVLSPSQTPPSTRAEEAHVPATPTAAPAPPTSAKEVLTSAELRGYVSHLLQALTTRARLSVVDGAVSAGVLLLLIRALSDPSLPIEMSARDRQRLCERFVFTLTSSLGGLTRAETLSCACSLRLVLQTVVLPFKKSFLETEPSLRVFHGCLSDSEADAFTMVQHALGDVITAMDKLVDDKSKSSVTVLDDAKAVLLLEQTGSAIALVRSLLEKMKGVVSRRVRALVNPAADVLFPALRRVEHEAAADGQVAAMDVLHLFTHHPPPSSKRENGTAATPTVSASAAAAQSSSSGGRRSSASPGDVLASEAHRTTASAPAAAIGRKRSSRGGRRERIRRISESTRAASAATAQASQGGSSQMSSRDHESHSPRQSGGGGGGGGDRKRSREGDDAVYERRRSRGGRSDRRSSTHRRGSRR